jgi:hypothetical protein
MHRTLEWVEKSNFLGWGCSQCAWLFDPSGTPVGESIEEMVHNYKQQRDKGFAAHVCANHPKPKNTKSK